MDELRFLVKEYDWLVVSNMAFIFNNIWDVILPIDELIFFKMVKTTNQMNMGVSINGYPIAGWFISWKVLFKWMIWGYHHFRKPPSHAGLLMMIFVAHDC